MVVQGGGVVHPRVEAAGLKVEAADESAKWDHFAGEDGCLIDSSRN